MGRLIWIIDEEWADYDAETALLRAWDPECELKFSHYDYAADLETFGTRADAILAQVYAPLPAATIRRLEQCRGIALFGGGYDRVDVAAARAMGISVTNVQGYCAEDLADYVLAAVFHFNKALTGFEGCAGRGVWGAQAVEAPPHRVSASTLLVVGCGRIGQTVARRAGALGMTVLGYDPHRTQEELSRAGIQKTELTDGLSRADYISVNARYCPETDGLLGLRELRHCKPTARLINTSRGRVLVERELVEAVRTGVIGGAVVDVVSNEPPTGEEEIFHCPGILVTPHVSYISQESFAELKRRSAQNAIDMMEGRRPADVVN